MEISAFFHNVISKKDELNSLMIYEGARFRELVRTFGIAQSSEAVEKTIGDLGHVDKLPVIKNALR